jgi:Na+-driven multidrug efflux pump
MTSAPRAEQAEVEQPARTAAARAEKVTYLSLLLFYLPLGFSGLMMTLDLPVVNAVLNRFPNPDTSVAALRVAFSMALVYEASHISIIDVSTALTADRRVFRLLGRFYAVMAVVLLIAASLVAFSPAYDAIVRGVMNISPEVAEAARPAFWAFLLWPIPIGWRRLCQGALIRHGHPKPVGAGGVVRLISLVAALAFFSWLSSSVVPIEPAAIAVLAMLVSVTAEALAVQGWTLSVLRSMPEVDHDAPPLTTVDIWRFFRPLALTAIMGTFTQPLLTASIASASVAWGSPNAQVVDVAAYALAWSVAILAFGPTLSMTQASITWHKNPDRVVRERGRRLILGLGVGLAVFIALVAFSPIGPWLFTTVLEGQPATSEVALQTLRLFVPMPILHSASFMLRGRMIAMGHPGAVRRSQMIDIGALFLLVLLATGPLTPLLRGAPAAPFAAIAYNLMLAVDIVVLSFGLRPLRR